MSKIEMGNKVSMVTSAEDPQFLLSLS